VRNKKLVIITSIILVTLFIGLAYFYKSNQNSLSNMEISLEKEHSMSFGENKKNIVVVEFMDPECESCAIFHTIIKKVYKEYYSDIKLVVRYLPNHKNSKFAIKILEASREQNKYNEVLNVIFEKQPLWAAHNNEKPELLWTLLAQIEGLDIDKLRIDAANPELDQLIDIDTNDARALGIRGTPTIFVNEKKLETLSQKDLLDLIEAEIYK
jgi:protein-disulfide isomerase